MRRTLWVCVVILPALVMAVAAIRVTGAEEDAPDYSRAGAETCLRCHDEDSAVPILDIFKTRHGRADAPGTPFAGLQCESCHGPGGAHAGRVRRGRERPGILNFGAAEEVPIDEQNAICSNCHESSLGEYWHGGAHESEDLACADCHQVHVAHDPVLDKTTQPDVCYDCHVEQKADALKLSTHPVRFGEMACADCHGAHGTGTPGELVRGSLNDTCYGCHAETRGPFVWEHAPVAEDCSLCHRPHGSNHPAMLQRRAPLLCQDCHAQQGHPSIAHTAAGLDLPGGSGFVLGSSCANCHTQVHGSNHPSGADLTR